MLRFPSRGAISNSLGLILVFSLFEPPTSNRLLVRVSMYYDFPFSRDFRARFLQLFLQPVDERITGCSTAKRHILLDKRIRLARRDGINSAARRNFISFLYRLRKVNSIPSGGSSGGKDVQQARYDAIMIMGFCGQSSCKSIPWNTANPDGRHLGPVHRTGKIFLKCETRFSNVVFDYAVQYEPFGRISNSSFAVCFFKSLLFS